MQRISYIDALKKAVVTMLVTLFVYQFYYIEIIRANIEDFAFDIVNEFVTYFIKDTTNSSNVMLFKFDNEYMRSEKLMDDNNETLYGYVFPRDKLAEFINSIDIFAKENKDNVPSMLFIDMDLSYSSNEQRDRLSIADNQLLEILKKDRPYKILIPKQSNYNFIESSNDLVIRNKIKNKELVFVSTSLTQATDNISRRYYPYQTFKNEFFQNVLYPNAALMMWALHQGYDLKNLTKDFHIEKKSLIENRIIFKNKYMFDQNKNFNAEQSYWNQLTTYSANYPLNNIPNEKFHKSILLVGSTHSGTNDKFTTNSFVTEISGVEMHANALMTLFHFDGKMNRLSLIETSLLVFFIVIFVNLLIQKLGLKYTAFKIHTDHYTVGISLLIMASCSVYFLLVEKLWFNWFILSLVTPLSIYIIVMNKLFKNILNMIQIVIMLVVVFITSKLFNFQRK